MNFTKQVEKSAYSFALYISKQRWNSIWHQIDEIIQMQPSNILEIGPGSGLLNMILKLNKFCVETVDIDPELNPDHVASVTKMPFVNNAFELVCAFQVLEHLPYEKALCAFEEMARVSEKKIIISLPDAKPIWSYSFYIPFLGSRHFTLTRPFSRKKLHKFDGEHYWEVNKIGYELDKVLNDLSKFMCLIQTYRVEENPTHRFFIFEHYPHLRNKE